MNYPPKIQECANLARKYRKQMVITLMFDLENNTIEYASYGKDKILCSEAKRLADAAYDAVCLAYTESDVL